MDTEQKNILDGVIDLHVHTAPDVIHRTYNDLELTDAAVRAGARAIVIKGHHCGTVSRAALCNAYNRAVHGDNSFYMYGGLVLNREAGGLNEQAVQTALRMGAKIIWLPTVDAENEYRKRGKTGGIRMTDSRGNLLPELLGIFSLIKAYDAVLATGHISPEEIHCVVDGARNAGVRKIVITHPEYWVVDLSVCSSRRRFRRITASSLSAATASRCKTGSGSAMLNAIWMRSVSSVRRIPSCPPTAATRRTLRGRKPCGSICNSCSITA